MFGGFCRIIFISKDKLVASEVVDVVNKKFGKTYEFGWTPQTLELTLSEVVKKYATKNFRVLVSDDLAYVVRVNLTPEMVHDKLRPFILSSIQDKVPDSIDEGEWDFRLLKGKTMRSEDAISFVLVKSFAQVFFEAVKKLDLKIEAIESETLAKTRDANPYIGIALKQDIKGKDEDVLNIQPNDWQLVRNDGSNVNISSSKPKMKLVLILVPIILIGILIGGLIYTRKSLEPARSPVETATPEATTEVAKPQASPLTTSVLPSASPAAIDFSKLKVQVQNGSGTPGEAGVVTNILKAEGFAIFSTQNASSFDYTETLVSTKDKYKEVYQVVERALNSDYTVKAGDTVKNDSPYDIVIVVGKRK